MAATRDIRAVFQHEAKMAPACGASYQIMILGSTEYPKTTWHVRTSLIPTQSALGFETPPKLAATATQQQAQTSTESFRPKMKQLSSQASNGGASGNRAEGVSITGGTFVACLRELGLSMSDYSKLPIDEKLLMMRSFTRTNYWREEVERKMDTVLNQPMITDGFNPIVDDHFSSVLDFLLCLDPRVWDYAVDYDSFPDGFYRRSFYLREQWTILELHASSLLRLSHSRSTISPKSTSDKVSNEASCSDPTRKRLRPHTRKRVAGDGFGEAVDR
ncbi:hypothetical protein BJ508DRAFT_315674 [Ascobolus immersus RN42]|uniref:Uncharacterized protein n=1 Tax=Ascobolus immersus RN42 TaxID=1160509 RepID=A0A3N4H9R9_ASCIM|nr:hypothetical protein BJ508DRAFT_315674 [Ascobolus immersus RN42]